MECPFRLRRAVRLWLRRLDRKTRDADLRIRCRVLLKVAAGLSRHAAARAVGCAPSSAWRMVTRWEQEGEASLFDRREHNGAHKLDGQRLAGLQEILTHSPDHYGYPRPTWTLEVLARVLQEQLGLTLSIGYLGKVLRGLGVRRGRPRPVVACPWPKARRQRRLAWLRRLATHCPRGEVVLYVDEVDIHLNPKIGWDWILPGCQRLVLTPGKNEKRYLAGAYDPVHQRLTYVAGDRKATWLFLNLLRALRAAYWWARTIHLILDNYVIHKTALADQLLRALGGKIQLHFLPPYCPQANRIERLWQDLHDNVTRNHRCPSMVALMRAVHRYLDERFSRAQYYVAAA